MLNIKTIILLAGSAAITLPLTAQIYTFEKYTVPRPGPTAYGQGINNRGEVVGSYVFGPRGMRGYRRYADGQFEAPILDPKNVELSTFAQGINDLNVIVGYYIGSDLNFHGFVDTGGSFVTFDALAGGSTQIYGINDLGDFVGVFGPSGQPPSHGFISTNGVVKQIDIKGAATTHLWGIDHTGASVGCATQVPGWQNRAFLRIPGRKDLLFRPPNASFNFCATGVNGDLGVVVGYFSEPSGTRVHGFIYNYQVAGGIPNPETGVVPVTVFDYPGADATYAYAVNTLGQISGYATVGTSPAFGFIATPIPTPPTGPTSGN